MWMTIGFANITLEFQLSMILNPRLLSLKSKQTKTILNLNLKKKKLGHHWRRLPSLENFEEKTINTLILFSFSTEKHSWIEQSHRIYNSFSLVRSTSFFYQGFRKQDIMGSLVSGPKICQKVNAVKFQSKQETSFPTEYVRMRDFCDSLVSSQI